jgi:S-adenosylmethionine:tRNA-ribosyltransferase-isomerase (queuine synthetase)
MSLKLEDFSYELPESRIAKHPPKETRDIKVTSLPKRVTFSTTPLVPLSDQLSRRRQPWSLMIPKVIPARIILHKDTGASDRDLPAGAPGALQACTKRVMLSQQSLHLEVYDRQC